MYSDVIDGVVVFNVDVVVLYMIFLLVLLLFVVM